MLIVGSRYTKGSQPIYLHPISIFFLLFFSWQYEPHRRACCSPRMENLLLHIWNVQIDRNDNLHCWKIYITRRRGLCYIISFLQSFSYLHTALLKWRLTTDSISENGGRGIPSHSLDLPPTSSTLYVHVRLQKQRSVKNNIHLISFFAIVFFFYFWFMNSHITFRKAICWRGL